MRGWRRGAIWLPERPAASNLAAAMAELRCRSDTGREGDSGGHWEVRRLTLELVGETARQGAVGLDAGVRNPTAAGAETTVKFWRLRPYQHA